jgi:hypothetical protein
MKTSWSACRVVGAAAVTAAFIFAGATSAGTSAGVARSLCVSHKPQCFETIQAAVDAAQDGDSVFIAPGTYAGGVVIPVSIALVGAGADSTTIKGGGPVVTIGVRGAGNEPTVSISGVTITGGLTRSAPAPSGPVTFTAVGGGVYIPGSAAGVGATVTIRDSVITRNRAIPTSTTDSGDPCPGGEDCPFAQALGGGIADVGRLTLINTTVSDNVAGGSLTSDAGGGGIWTATNGGPGELTLIGSTVTGNTATVIAPNGRSAIGGGIEVQDGETFTVTRSVVSNNAANISSSYPSGVGVGADSGGIHIGGSGVATIQGTRISGNIVSADDPAGDPAAFVSALGVGLSECVCGQTLVLKDAVISGNRTIATGGDSALAASAVELDVAATVSGTAIIRNTIASTSLRGGAVAGGALFASDSQAEPIVLMRSIVAGNTVKALASAGAASVGGAGINNGGSLRLQDVLVGNNAGDATGLTGSAHGGGIWNGMPFGPDGPTPHLSLERTVVVGNSMRASRGLSVQGGGLFTPGFPVVQLQAVIARNSPDQCFGC